MANGKTRDSLLITCKARWRLREFFKIKTTNALRSKLETLVTLKICILETWLECLILLHNIAPELGDKSSCHASTINHI